jgi:hypothetical protein
MQAWIDIVSSGIETSQVKMLGINGGLISAMEYRVALALGAQVGIIKGSGREADALLSDPEWAMARTLVSVTPELESVTEFLAQEKP